ncbi:putative protein phosphatase 2C 38 [Senna tora]|uniref:protein-serine/threonine phosphatase n=1 Tax=Senna tora TaxID=362788 RepID=A0A834TAX1_9FABA|nr:putative protein phosphatase 2C 38 [Senna tora]
MVRSCWKPSVEGEDGDLNGRVDGLLWYKDLGNHVYGEFSMAVIQANSSLEDRSQLESGPLTSNLLGPQGTFIGVYDGHGGTEASQFVTDNLFFNLKRFAGEDQGMSENVIRRAFSATEGDFLSLVKKQWIRDSKVVLGRVERATREIEAIQLCEEHNVNIETVRDEIRSKHPYDSQIVVVKHNVWRVKGLIQVSRSIGDAYLKKGEFNREPLPSKFILPEPFFKPILSSEPSISTHKIQPQDQFLIFASDGLWEHLTNQEAVNIVTNYPRNGIARRLVKAALREAARKREMRLSDLQKIGEGDSRRQILYTPECSCLPFLFLQRIRFGNWSKLSEPSFLLCLIVSSSRTRNPKPARHNQQLDRNSEPLSPAHLLLNIGKRSIVVNYSLGFGAVGGGRSVVGKRWLERRWLCRRRVVCNVLGRMKKWFVSGGKREVPSLEHNGKVVGESLDVIKYIDANFQGPSLFPSEPDKRDFGEQLISHVNTFTNDVYSSFKGDPVQQTSSAFDYLETALGKFDDGPFFLAQLSLVDIAYISFLERFQIVFSELFNHDITAGRPKLGAWIEEMNKFDAYKHTKVDRENYVEAFKKKFLA